MSFSYVGYGMRIYPNYIFATLYTNSIHVYYICRYTCLQLIENTLPNTFILKQLLCYILRILNTRYGIRYLASGSMTFSLILSYSAAIDFIVTEQLYTWVFDG
jgi:hypothetical protein